MLFVVELGGRSFVEVAKVQDGWGWGSGMIVIMLKVGSGYFGMFVSMVLLVAWRLLHGMVDLSGV
jgi:hypothetical protein